MATPTEVDRCERLEHHDATLERLKLGVSSCSKAWPTLEALETSTSLKELFITSAISREEEIKILCEHLLRNASLERITLDLRGCSDRGAQHLADLIGQSKHVKWFSLLLNGVTAVGAKALAGALAKSTLLGFSIYATQLDLHDRCIGDGGARHFADALRTTASLCSICIAQNGVTDLGLESILVALQSNRVVTALDLHSNKITHRGAFQLAVYLSSNTSLKQLTLDENHEIGSEGAKEIALALCNNASLETLCLKSCCIGRKGGERFGMTLNQNEALRELILCGNVDIGDDAIELLCRGLKRNSCLEQLDLSSCGVGDGGCSALADALIENTRLTHLFLDKNGIGDGGALALSAALSKNTTITSLVLRGNHLGQKAVSSLLQVLEQNSSLTTLELGSMATVTGDSLSGTAMSLSEVLLAKNRQLQESQRTIRELQLENRQLRLERDALLVKLHA